MFLQSSFEIPIPVSSTAHTTKLPSIFAEVNEEIKKHVEYLGNLPENYLDNFDKWASGLEKISEVNTASLQKNMGISRKVADISQPSTGGLFSFPTTTEQPTRGRAAVSRPEPKETPAEVTKKAQAKSQQDVAIQQLLNAIQQLISVGGNQTSELQAIKTQLETGIRTIDGSPLG